MPSPRVQQAKRKKPSIPCNPSRSRTRNANPHTPRRADPHPTGPAVHVCVAGCNLWATSDASLVPSRGTAHSNCALFLQRMLLFLGTLQSKTRHSVRMPGFAQGEATSSQNATTSTHTRHWRGEGHADMHNNHTFFEPCNFFLTTTPRTPDRAF